MMILAIDTATRWLGLALHDSATILAEYGWHCANTHTVDLAPAVSQMFQQTHVGPADLTGLAVAIGPGSYTGLRVGLAFAKGLAIAHQIALIGIPTLDIVAAAQPENESGLAVVAEAGRSRIWLGHYKWQKGWQAIADPTINSWENFLAEQAGPLTFAGEINPTAAKLIRAAGKGFRLSSATNNARRAGYLAELGWQRLRRGRVNEARSLAPTYLVDPAGK